MPLSGINNTPDKTEKKTSSVESAPFALTNTQKTKLCTILSESLNSGNSIEQSNKQNKIHPSWKELLDSFEDFYYEDVFKLNSFTRKSFNFVSPKYGFKSKGFNLGKYLLIQSDILVKLGYDKKSFKSLSNISLGDMTLELDFDFEKEITPKMSEMFSLIKERNLNIKKEIKKRERLSKKQVKLNKVKDPRLEVKLKINNINIKKEDLHESWVELFESFKGYNSKAMFYKNSYLRAHFVNASEISCFYTGIKNGVNLNMDHLIPKSVLESIGYTKNYYNSIMNLVLSEEEFNFDKSSSCPNLKKDIPQNIRDYFFRIDERNKKIFSQYTEFQRKVDRNICGTIKHRSVMTYKILLGKNSENNLFQIENTFKLPEEENFIEVFSKLFSLTNINDIELSLRKLLRKEENVMNLVRRLQNYGLLPLFDFKKRESCNNIVHANWKNKNKKFITYPQIDSVKYEGTLIF